MAIAFDKIIAICRNGAFYNFAWDYHSQIFRKIGLFAQ